MIDKLVVVSLILARREMVGLHSDYHRRYQAGTTLYRHLQPRYCLGGLGVSLPRCWQPARQPAYSNGSQSPPMGSVSSGRRGKTRFAEIVSVTRSWLVFIVCNASMPCSST